jgi:hypothetical protein
MHIAWGALLIVFVVSFASAVAVVALVAFALVAFSGRARAGTSGQPALVGASSGPSATGGGEGVRGGSGNVVGWICLVAAAVIVLYGLLVIIGV